MTDREKALIEAIRVTNIRRIAGDRVTIPQLLFEAIKILCETKDKDTFYRYQKPLYHAFPIEFDMWQRWIQDGKVEEFEDGLMYTSHIAENDDIWWEEKGKVIHDQREECYKDAMDFIGVAITEDECDDRDRKEKRKERAPEGWNEDTYGEYPN